MNEQEWMIHWMNRNKWFMEWTGMNDSLNDQGWMIQLMQGINDSLNEQEWMIQGMNRNEWFSKWTGMIELNEQERMIHGIFWMNRNDWFIEWTGMIDSLNDQGCMIHWINSNEESFNEQG